MASIADRADGQVCLVTGANAGIGFVTAQGLAEHGAAVVLLCRDRGRGEAALARIKQATDNRKLHLLVCDLASQRQIRRAAEQFKALHQRLDVLINNAAIYCRQRTQTEDGLETQFAVNYLSYFLLTHLLLDLLRASAPSRVVNLTTINHHYVSLRLDDLQSERDYEPKTVHMRSKLAVILFTFELARFARQRGSRPTACTLA